MSRELAITIAGCGAILVAAIILVAMWSAADDAKDPHQ